MHTILLVMLTMLVVPSQTTPYQGRFEAKDPSTGGLIILDLTNKDNRVTGQYREADNEAAACTIEAKISDGTMKGKMTNIATPLFSFSFTASQQGNKIVLSLDDPSLAALMPPLHFARADGSKTASKTDIKQGAKTQDPSNPLLGTWVYAERYSSGEFWSVRREVMEFNASTITLYEPTILANDANTSASINPKGKSIGVFRYELEGNRILVFHPETGAKIPLSTYSFYEGRLVTVTTQDKKRQIWERL
jgi:hypothetical protein